MLPMAVFGDSTNVYFLTLTRSKVQTVQSDFRRSDSIRQQTPLDSPSPATSFPSPLALPPTRLLLAAAPPSAKATTLHQVKPPMSRAYVLAFSPPVPPTVRVISFTIGGLDMVSTKV
jgi:hypothetical protein